MYQIDHCPACQGYDLTFRPAVVSPFIARYVLGRSVEPCRVAKCNTCGMSFYEDRFSESEMIRLYAGYRGDEYASIRCRIEPEYSVIHHEEQSGLANRRETYQKVMTPYTVSTVLDYGGDRGQMIVGGPGAHHYVYDISGVPTVHGVTAVSDPGTYDLVLLCEVLEHLPDPVQELREVIEHMEPGGLLYISVPANDYDAAKVPSAVAYQAMLSLAIRVHPVVRPILGNRLGKFLLHEHINSFTSNALRALLETAGLEVILLESARHHTALCRRSGQLDR